MRLQLHYTNYTTPQLQVHDAITTTTAALHHTTSSSCERDDRPGDHCNHCNHSKKHNSNHLSVHQCIRSAIHDSQQRFPIFETSAAALCGTTGTDLELQFRPSHDQSSAAGMVISPPQESAPQETSTSVRLLRSPFVSSVQNPFWLMIVVFESVLMGI